jgi:hypothetical protein
VRLLNNAVLRRIFASERWMKIRNEPHKFSLQQISLRCMKSKRKRLAMHAGSTRKIKNAYTEFQ